MKFSIIIPTLNESANIVSCLVSIMENISGSIRKEDIEIIIIDAGSRDDTLCKAVDIGISIDLKTINSEKVCLPKQLNIGAEEAKGDILLFLHADCTLPRFALKRIKDVFGKYPGLVGGAFTMVVEGGRFFYRILSAGGNLYCWLSRNYFGDRAMFIKKGVFRTLSGFKPLPIMSDFELAQRMKKEGRVAMVKGPVISSSRKFEKEPFYVILYLIIWSILAFCLGVDKESIREKYYEKNGSKSG